MKKILPLSHGLRGSIEVPGDKSISHRAVMLSSLGDTTVEIKNFLRGADCLSTIGCMRSMGVDVVDEGDRLLIKGRGLDVDGFTGGYNLQAAFAMAVAAAEHAAHRSEAFIV